MTGPADSTEAASQELVTGEGLRTRPYNPFPTFARWEATSGPMPYFAQYARQFEETRAATDAAVLKESVNIATRWAAIDTGAIEGLYDVERGFTISMAVSGALLENIQAQKGAEVARTVENALEAYEYVLDIATKSHPLTEVWLRELHQTICRNQETYTVATEIGPQEHSLKKGQYKEHPNSPYNFASQEVHGYALPEETPAEMARLIAEMRTPEFEAAHPVNQAAYAHYSFVCIHPFADGNGRVSRALASVFLYRALRIPLVIFADQKAMYISALESADSGHFDQFNSFVAERVIDTIGMVQAAIASASIPSIADQLRTLTALGTGRGGLPHQELDAIAMRLSEQFGISATEVLNEQFGKTEVAFTVERTSDRESPLSDYRVVPNAALTQQLRIVVRSPASGAASRSFAVIVARPDVQGPDFLIVHGRNVVLEVFLREVHPVLSGALKYRFAATLEAIVREMMAEVTRRVQSNLQSQGYSA